MTARSPSRPSALVRWARPARIFGAIAIAAGAGLFLFPDAYTNPSYRVVFAFAGPQVAGVAWIVVGSCTVVQPRRWSIALLGSAAIGWGLGLGYAAIAYSGGSPFGWLWFVGIGLTVLRGLDLDPPPSRRRPGG